MVKMHSEITVTSIKADFQEERLNFSLFYLFIYANIPSIRENKTALSY